LTNQPGSKFKIYPPFVLVGLVVVYCTIASSIQFPQSIVGIELKEINFFSDFLKSEKNNKSIPKTKINPKVKSAADSLHFTGVAIENFYETKSDKLAKFIDKLNNVKKQHKKIRIAWFGDSMVEGDILVQDLREALQEEFGGEGIGFVPITSVTGNFRQTIYTENSGNWETVSILKNEQHQLPLGIGGEAFKPQNGSWVSFKATNKKKHLSVFHHAELFIYNPDSAAIIEVVVDNSSTKQLEIKPQTSVQKIEIGSGQTFKQIKVKFNTSKSAFVYGINFDSESGVFVDNFGLRGSSGIAMGAMQPYSLLTDWQNIHSYDLMILEYGLNIVSPKTKQYDWFEKAFPKSIHKMEESFPEAATLLLSIGDRASNNNGVYQTMEQVPIFINIQKSISSKSKVAFWNMNEAMGGDSSMIKWVNTKPRLANTDYTHINERGGEYLAKKLFETIMFESKRQRLHL
jgi:hypothetical protein